MIIKKLNKYQIVSLTDITAKQLRTLAKLFNEPFKKADSVLGGRRSIISANFNGLGPIIIKQYMRGGFIKHIIKKRYMLFGKTRCQIEFDALRKARKAGINVPEPLAYITKGGLFYQGWLITKEIKKKGNLAELRFSSKSQERELLRDLSLQISMLIENKILHVDLHPGNVIVDQKERIYLLDFDKSRSYWGAKEMLKKKYLARWNRAITKHDLPEALRNVLFLDSKTIE